jgi:hypothetical protein
MPGQQPAYAQPSQQQPKRLDPDQMPSAVYNNKHNIAYYAFLYKI